MQSRERIRRSDEEWQKIISAWQTSEQSAAQYCQSQGLSYATFCKWRRRLKAESQSKPLVDDFINLSSLSERSEGSWHITLKLGGDVELVLSR